MMALFELRGVEKVYENAGVAVPWGRISGAAGITDVPLAVRSPRSASPPAGCGRQRTRRCLCRMKENCDYVTCGEPVAPAGG